MSKKKKRKHNTIIRVGHFYNVHDGSVNGHPAKVLNVDYKNQEYIVIITETKTNDGRNIPLLVPTDSFVKQSFLKPNTYYGTRDDFGEKEYFDMKIDKKDLQKQESIKRKRIKYLRNYKKKYKIKIAHYGLYQVVQVWTWNIPIRHDSFILKQMEGNNAIINANFVANQI